MYEVCTQASFSAAHRLVDYDGPCENLHGHNWLVKVYARAEKLDHVGIAIDFKVLKGALNEVLSQFDHKDLNLALAGAGINPSSENMARHIFGLMQARIDDENCKIVKVKVYETPTNYGAYFEKY